MQLRRIANPQNSFDDKSISLIHIKISYYKQPTFCNKNLGDQISARVLP